MKYLFYFATTLCSVLFWSCNQDSSVLEPQVESEGGVSFCVPAFEPEDGSRVNVTVNSSGAKFVWGAEDKVGTFSREGGLLRFEILSSDVNSPEAHFKGAGFSLDPNTEYCAFYPFVDAVATSIPVSYVGQKQVGDDNTDHLGAYDYIYSPFQSTNARGEIMFPMKHLGSLVRFKLTMPAADTYSRFRLAGHYTCRFLVNTSYDITSAEPSLVWWSPSSEFILNLQNISTTAPGQEITLYAMMAPHDYTSLLWHIEVTGALRTYQTTMEHGRNFQAGFIHGIKRTLY